MKESGLSMNGTHSSKWLIRGTILAILTLVAVPLVVKQAPREVARWYQAAAFESRLDGQAERAYQQLSQAAAWDPANLDFAVLRATWLREDDRTQEALAACDSTLQANPEHMAALAERSQILQQLGRFADAVADWKTISHVNEQSSVLPDVLVWNALAYARAVADLELAEALADAERAVARIPESAALLDTRGYVYYRLGKDADAKRDLDKAVALADAQRAPLANAPPKNRSSQTDSREWDSERKRLDNELAVIIYHRSLVLERLGDVSAAEADRARVRQLGFTPDEHLF